MGRVGHGNGVTNGGGAASRGGGGRHKGNRLVSIIGLFLGIMAIFALSLVTVSWLHLAGLDCMSSSSESTHSLLSVMNNAVHSQDLPSSSASASHSSLMGEIPLANGSAIDFLRFGVYAQAPLTSIFDSRMTSPSRSRMAFSSISS